MEQNNKKIYYSHFCFEKESKFGTVEGMVCNLKSSTYHKEDGQEFKKLNFALACNRIDNKVKYILDIDPAISNQNPDTVFVSCVAFGATAERLEKFLNDKDRVLATGKLSYFEGTSGNIINLNVKDVFLIKKNGESKSSSYTKPEIGESYSSIDTMVDVDDDDDIPF